MKFSVLLWLRVMQSTWRPEFSHMTFCSPVLHLQTAEQLQFVKFAFQVAIILYYNKHWSYDGGSSCWGWRSNWAASDNF